MWHDSEMYVWWFRVHIHLSCKLMHAACMAAAHALEICGCDRCVTHECDTCVTLTSTCDMCHACVTFTSTNLICIIFIFTSTNLIYHIHIHIHKSYMYHIHMNLTGMWHMCDTWIWHMCHIHILSKHVSHTCHIHIHKSHMSYSYSYPQISSGCECDICGCEHVMTVNVSHVDANVTHSHGCEHDVNVSHSYPLEIWMWHIHMNANKSWLTRKNGRCPTDSMREYAINVNVNSHATYMNGGATLRINVNSHAVYTNIYTCVYIYLCLYICTYIYI